jgi:hypothetical protein
MGGCALKSGSEGRHDSLVSLVRDRLVGYDYVGDHFEYKSKKCGEVDLYAIKNNKVLIFEMKCNYQNRKKAIDQLARARKYCFNDFDRAYLFFVYYTSRGNYAMERIRP